MQVSRDLLPVLERWDLAELDAHAGAVYGVTSELRLGYLNAAWFRFAADNGGEPHISADWSLGRSVLASVRGPLRDFYASNYRACLDATVPWQHEYECSSTETYRRYHQIVYPLEARAGLLIVNSLVVERARDVAEPVPFEPEAYVGADGFITQCTHCRRVRRTAEPDRWDWIPVWVAEFPRETDHGLCGPCFRFHYPSAA